MGHIISHSGSFGSIQPLLFRNGIVRLSIFSEEPIVAPDFLLPVSAFLFIVPQLKGIKDRLAVGVGHM
jgi:hypothetical protein